ncbi:hypothetical protein GQ55_8G037400 [Panicum hallii var. hallii]|uniref:Uncharacterized protein n=1 Tax=Panicum hallii var. hallii TaxID=1504633 RepID=A0A2T7CKN7_9POAL|nr:hypothetical protein GQ55_8G037400 [Panicum hallii var. hallii]
MGYGLVNYRLIFSSYHLLKLYLLRKRVVHGCCRRREPPMDHPQQGMRTYNYIYILQREKQEQHLTYWKTDSDESIKFDLPEKTSFLSSFI